jgi:transporter family-2 protein
MYKNIAIMNGMFLAVMIFFNGMLSSKVGPLWGTLIFHGVGICLILVLSIMKKNKLPNLFKLKWVAFIPGIISVITIVLNNLCIPQLGVTLTIGISLYGQLVISSVIGHFGLFGTPISKVRKDKIPGLTMISIGILMMILL